LLERAPIGVTLHVVNRGIDTGDILLRIPVAVTESDNVASIEARVIEQSLEVLVRAAIEGPEGFQRGIRQERSEGHQYHLMPFATARRLEREWPAIKQTYQTAICNEACDR
jgi:methionyl-tRNA formyltransferase